MTNIVSHWLEHHLFCHMTSWSASKSLISTAFRFETTSGCGVIKSHPTCAKKKPLLTLWGSALVSLYLWCTLWSNAHLYTSFYRRNLYIFINGSKFLNFNEWDSYFAFRKLHFTYYFWNKLSWNFVKKIMKKSYISYFEKFKFFYLLISILLNFSELIF